MYFQDLKWYNQLTMEKKRYKTKMMSALFVFFLIFQWNHFLMPQEEMTQSESPYWWHLVVNVDVSGSYHYRFPGEEKGFDGQYHFTTTVLGNLQEDEGDYIFMKAHQEIEPLNWQETVYIPGVKRTFDLKDKIKPNGTLNYVFREKKLIYFDLDFQSLRTPYNNQVIPGPVKQLTLPASAGVPTVNIREKYNRGVMFGTNLITVNDKSIYQDKFVNRNFNWKWETTDNEWTNTHEVKVEIKIVRMEKK